MFFYDFISLSNRFAKIPGGKIISKIQTPAGYTLKVYNVINTLTRQGQAEA